MTTKVYVRLLGEGTEVWRPVEATLEAPGLFRIVGKNLNPIDEQWEFAAGELVNCEERRFSDGGGGLAAVSKHNRG